MSDTAIKSALRRSLHFENINSGNIGKMSDDSYYKFFVYDDNNFLEVEIMGGEILSARYTGSVETVKIDILKENTNRWIAINGFTPNKLDIEYSFGVFTLDSTQKISFNNNTTAKDLKSGESKYYGVVISDMTSIANTIETTNVTIGTGASETDIGKLSVNNIKLGKWNMSLVDSDGDAINIRYDG